MLYETDLGDLIDFSKRWASLGDAVAEEVEQAWTTPAPPPAGDDGAVRPAGRGGVAGGGGASEVAGPYLM